MLHRTRGPSRRPAATLVETAVVIGALLLMLLAIYEYGRFVMIKQLVANATREGARQAIVTTTSGTTSAVQGTVTNYLAGQPLQNLTINVYAVDPSTGNNLGSWNSATFGNAIAVQVTANYQPMLPTFGFLPNPVNLKSTAIMRSEAN
jgi:Flp pilus assembly protein TadG